MAPFSVLYVLLMLANLLLLLVAAHNIPTPKLFGRTAILALKASSVPAGGSSATAVRRESAGRNLTPVKRQTPSGQCGPGKGVCSAGICCSPEGNCGLGPDYCNSPDCQIDYGSGCDGLKTPPGPSTLGITRPQVSSIPYGGNGVYDCLVAGTVALTFDDGPGIYTSDILDILDTYNAKATFFITGINNGKGEIDNTSLPWPALIKRMYASGHQIASHTWSHQDLSIINAQQRQDQMIKNEMALRNILGFFPTYMRPPYSDCTVASGCETTLNTLGYHIVYFDVDTDDYDNDSPLLIQNSKNNFNNAFAGHSAASNDFLVIAHDIHEQTAHNLTTYMLQTLLAQGFKPVTLGDCLGDPAANWYRTASGVATVSPVSAITSAVTSVTASTTTSASTTTIATTAAKAASTDGSCGTAATQFTCIASQFGNCCSQYGWCGNTAAFCGTGCQSGGGAGTCT